MSYVLFYWITYIYNKTKMETKIKVCKKHGETTYQKNSQGKWICIKCRTEAKVKSRRKITKLN